MYCYLFIHLSRNQIVYKNMCKTVQVTLPDFADLLLNLLPGKYC